MLMTSVDSVKLQNIQASSCNPLGACSETQSKVHKGAGSSDKSKFTYKISICLTLLEEQCVSVFCVYTGVCVHVCAFVCIFLNSCCLFLQYHLKEGIDASLLSFDQSFSSLLEKVTTNGFKEIMPFKTHFWGQSFYYKPFNS